MKTAQWSSHGAIAATRSPPKRNPILGKKEEMHKTRSGDQQQIITQSFSNPRLGVYSTALVLRGPWAPLVNSSAFCHTFYDTSNWEVAISDCVL